MALHFSGEHPEDQFYTDFGNLNRFDDEVGLNTEFTGSSWKYYCFVCSHFLNSPLLFFIFWWPHSRSVSLSSCLCDSVSTPLLILQPSYQLIPLPSSHPTSSPSWRSFPHSTVLDSMHSRTWWSLCSSYPICCFGPILKLIHMMCDHPAILVSWSSFPARICGSTVW